MEVSENCVPLNTEKNAATIPIKSGYLPVAQITELARIDELIERLQSGAFSEDMDHPYYIKYLASFEGRDRKKQATSNRFNYSRECVLRNYECARKQSLLEYQLDLLDYYRTEGSSRPSTANVAKPLKMEAIRSAGGPTSSSRKRPPPKVSLEGNLTNDLLLIERHK